MLITRGGVIPSLPSSSFPNSPSPKWAFHGLMFWLDWLLGVPWLWFYIFCCLKFWEKETMANRASPHPSCSRCSSLLWNVSLLSGIPTAPFNSWTLDQSANLFSSLSLLVKAMHCGYFWFFLFNYISLCLLWSELIDLFSWGVASVL